MKIIIVSTLSVLFSLAGAFAVLKMTEDQWNAPAEDTKKHVEPKVAFAGSAPVTFDTLKTDRITKVLDELEAKQKKQDDREGELSRARSRIEMERKDLEALRDEIQKKRDDFDKAARDFEEKRIAIDSEQMKNLKKLASTYATLSPAAVVAIFDDMEQGLAVKILSLMKPEEIGPIFEEMTNGNEEMRKKATSISNSLRLLSPSK